MTPLPVIVNPVAGGGRARRAAAAVAVALQRRGVAADLLETTGPGHARRLAADLVAAGAGRIVACGGDGTQHEVAAALAGTSCALGILPFGRGNDLAAAMGIPRRPEAAAEVLLSGGIRTIDVGYADGAPFCTVASAGFDAEVANRTRTGWWRHTGWLAYPLGVVAGLFSFRAPRIRVEGDFGVREGRYLLVAASNTGMYGGGVRIAPDAVPDDGQFDCCLVRDLPRWKLLVVFPLAYSGRHLGFEEIEILRTATLRITADRILPVIADGEAMGHTPVALTLRRGALRVVVPAGTVPVGA